MILISPRSIISRRWHILSIARRRRKQSRWLFFSFVRYTCCMVYSFLLCLIGIQGSWVTSRVPCGDCFALLLTWVRLTILNLMDKQRLLIELLVTCFAVWLLKTFGREIQFFAKSSFLIIGLLIAVHISVRFVLFMVLFLVARQTLALLGIWRGITVRLWTSWHRSLPFTTKSMTTYNFLPPSRRVQLIIIVVILNSKWAIGFGQSWLVIVFLLATTTNSSQGRSVR